MEGEGHLNLRWDDHTLTFVHLLNHFRLQELYCDASLACAGGGVYPVHKVVLSACSDFFASIFASASCQNPVVVLQDVAREHLEALLTYVYRGEVLLARPDLTAFLKVAESLQVKGLAPPPLIPLSRDTWGASNGISPPHDTPHHAQLPPPYSHPDPDSLTYSRQEIPSPPQARCGAPWDGEGIPRSSAPLLTPPRARGASQGDGDSLRLPRKRFSPHFAAKEQFGGTFQNLVASEEGEIKEEPLEEGPEFFDTDRLMISEKEGQEEEEEEMEEQQQQQAGMKDGDEEEEKEVNERQNKDGEGRGDERHEDNQQKTQQEEVMMEGDCKREDKEEEEGRGGLLEVKIMLDTRQRSVTSSSPSSSSNTPARTPTLNTTNGPTHSPSPSLSTHSPTPSHPTHSPSPTLAHHARSPSQPHALSPTPAHPAHSPTPNPPVTTSQLRRELLKPLQYRVAPQPHHAIPHPVIASGKGEGGVSGEGVEVPREPPPLVKIPAPPPVTSPPLQYHHHPHHHLLHHHHHHHHRPQHRQSDGRDDTTTTTTTSSITSLPFTPATTTSTTTSLPSKSHHLLVTTQPTYRTRLPPPPTAPLTPIQYPPTLTEYKDVHLMDTDAPLNLSQDTHHAHRHAHGHHRHRSAGTHRSEQDRHSRDRDPFLGKILTNRKRRLRGPKSWEYLVRLLRDPSTNPSLIRWENEANGIFRLVQPAVIAQRWGRRTGKHASDCLTYENFARGLRYHYATGALEPVSERSFVYKFGPKALLALGDGECQMTAAAAEDAMVPTTYL